MLLDFPDYKPYTNDHFDILIYHLRLKDSNSSYLGFSIRPCRCFMHQMHKGKEKLEISLNGINTLAALPYCFAGYPKNALA